MDKIIEEATQDLIRKIRESGAYREYLRQRNILLEQPELFEQVDKFRNLNFEMQSKEQEGLFEKSEKLVSEYAELLENPSVNDFLEAELEFCRMIQDINMMIATEVDFI